MGESAAEFFQHVSRELALGRTVAVALVTRRRGSGPRRPGAKLVLSADGQVWGTVGGGDFEFRVLQRARVVLQAGRPERVSFDMRNEDAAAAGMMCGGWIEALLVRLRPDDPAAARVLDRAQAALIARQPFIFTVSGAGDGESSGSTLDLIIDGQSLAGTSHAPDPAAPWSVPPADEPGPDFQVGPAGCRFAEWVLPPEAVFVFGAGHVGEELAPLCRRAGFWTVVLDDRPEFACRDRFPDAHQVIVVDRYAGSLSRLPVDDRSYIVIVTRGHLHDREVLEQALATPARYIGMIGSPRKWATIRAALERAGCAAEVLDMVRSPVGLAIGAETPAELALCIAAELVAVRRGVQPRRRRL
jgi:xanthine dehydrogenase accessory factor